MEVQVMLQPLEEEIMSPVSLCARKLLKWCVCGCVWKREKRKERKKEREKNTREKKKRGVFSHNFIPSLPPFLPPYFFLIFLCLYTSRSSPSLLSLASPNPRQPAHHPSHGHGEADSIMPRASMFLRGLNSRSPSTRAPAPCLPRPANPWEEEKTTNHDKTQTGC